MSWVLISIVLLQALDKIRFEGLTDKGKLESQPELYIHIVPDKTNNTIAIIDSGIGMTKAGKDFITLNIKFFLIVDYWSRWILWLQVCCLWVTLDWLTMVALQCWFYFVCDDSTSLPVIQISWTILEQLQDQELNHSWRHSLLERISAWLDSLE